jgi:hypothetical protein
LRHSARKRPFKGLYECVIGGLPRPAEVKRDAVRVGPQIQIARDELRSLIDADRRGIAGLGTNPFQGMHHVLAPIAEPMIKDGHIAREGVHHGEHSDLLSCCQLIMDKVHGPGLVGSRGFTAIVAQLGFDPPLI